MEPANNPANNPAKNTSILDALLANETEQQDDASGLARFSGLRIKTASDYIAIPPQVFSTLRENLTLYKSLPKPPSLGSLNFLITKGATDIKEQFEDHWTAASVSYAAACEVYVQIARLVEDAKIAPDHELVAATRRLLLTVQNTPARALQTYKHLARRQALKGAAKPSQTRDQVLTADEAKALHTEIDTARKLKQKTSTKPRRRYGQGFYTSFKPSPSTYPSNRGGGNRGRGRGRRGRGRGRQ
jgi:hypothetical protein